MAATGAALIGDNITAGAGGWPWIGGDGAAAADVG